ncbi:MAG: trypsin-like serine protease [Bdellovibrionales bacterium]|nr:trypsin-like serine protease [Bdellovibrionales bacterium]
MLQVKTLSLLLLSIGSALASNDSPKIENPSKKLAQKEAEILKRVVRLQSTEAECTGVWLEDGIIATADHCKNLVKDGTITVNKVRSRVIQLGLVMSDEKSAEMARTSPEKLLSEEGRGSGGDFMLMLVDSSGLTDLPKDPLPLAPTKAGNVPAGIDMLIAGFGTSGEKAPETIQAAMVTTGEVTTTTSGYSLMFPATRTVQVAIGCPAGKTINYCEVLVGFGLADKKHKDPSTENGDSGGPAFVKDSSGNWVLQGLCSSAGFRPTDKSKSKVEYVYQGKKDSIKLVLADRKERSDDKFYDHAFGKAMFVLSNILKVDIHRPLPSEYQTLQSYEGEVLDYHVNVADPRVRTIIDDYVAKMRKVREDFSKANQGQILRPVTN